VTVSGDVGNKFAVPVVGLIAAEELALLETAARALRGDQSRSDWERISLERIRRWRLAARRGMPGALARLGEAVRAALLGAHEAGQEAALMDLPGKPVAPTGRERSLILSQDRLGAQLAAVLLETPRLLEAHLREVVRAGADDVRGGRSTRRAASQQVLNRLVGQGVVGFRDSAGRNWSLTSYAEMAVRTEVQAQALSAGEETIKALGLTQVVVSDSPRECPLCRPFEGKVLNLEGTGPGTLAYARAKGFQHPNCTHSYSAFIPGVTKLRKAEANPDGYEAKQEQRRIERKIREWKRAEILALDPSVRARASANVKTWQARLRRHVKDNGLKRLPGRESVKKAI
jgi:Phage minor capsid protein 2